MNFLVDATNTKRDNFEDFRECEIYPKTKFKRRTIKYNFNEEGEPK